MLHKYCEDDMPQSLRLFTYKELKTATNSFTHKLGRGAFGSIFKGSLSNRTLVAVKKIESSRGGEKRFLAEINTIGNIHHLQSNGNTITIGTLGKMKEMRTLLLELKHMPGLPTNMNVMSQLKKLDLRFPHLVEIEPSFCHFQYLGHLRLENCNMLEDLPDLHKLAMLRRFEIIEFGRLKTFPYVFGESEAFPALDMLSLVSLDTLQELRISEEGAMLGGA
ncbi:hypothetical protein KI387_021871 [Taxus chinensis]|uniref:Protein kinase domain-containing protein n=1 Tax=Taxus chinensis TaxID=29808 RepID=A0AA38GE85_TAXCH|nr:hypothetical protein KI387_021871 [Taxus chinensis]